MSNYESDLTKQMSEFFADPYGFVMFAFPWGASGSVLANEQGPDKWQIDVLRGISDGIMTVQDAIQLAVSSGHGIGKSALVTWLILWAMSTRPDLSGVVTAGTKTQLETKTWRELSKWHKLMINEHWFKWTATKFYHVDHPETWFVAAIPWREENPEAFAGQHEAPFNVLVIYDEASSVPDVIWEVSEGAMTTKGAMWFVFGNPTRNTGRFRECFNDGKFSHRWKSMQIDSRTAKMTNKSQLQQWVDDYGEDSDFVKVRIRGVFPSASLNQLIASETVKCAGDRILELDPGAALVIGVDVARFGDNETVFVLRKGRKMLPNIYRYKGLDTMQTSSQLCRIIDMYKPDQVFIDGVGIGGAVVDRCRSLGYKVVDVQSGGRPINDRLYSNKRIELWCELKQWLDSADIPNERELYEQLIAVEYKYHDKGDKMVLESKEDMKKRGIASPDIADALALTFAMPVRRLDIANANRRVMQAETDYNIFNYGS